MTQPSMVGKLYKYQQQVQINLIDGVTDWQQQQFFKSMHIPTTFHI